MNRPALLDRTSQAHRIKSLRADAAQDEARAAALIGFAEDAATLARQKRAEADRIEAQIRVAA